MKKIFIFVIAICLVVLAACSANPTNSAKDTENNEAEGNYNQVVGNMEKDSVEWFDIYQVTDAEPLFSYAMANNSIDKKYKSELSNRSTTAELVEMEKEYINIWQHEMDTAIIHLTDLLSDSNRTAFLSAQESWQRATEQNMEFEYGVLKDKENIGSSFSYLYLSEWREIYRERTIRVKYILYLLEQAENRSPANYKSLQFENAEDR